MPPFMGKDVTSVAPRSIYSLHSAPVDFWNQRVFRFGGRIIPGAAEDTLTSPATIEKAAGDILSRVSEKAGMSR